MNEKFVITIARGYGSGGRTIGKMLSKNLSIPFYDRDLVYMASEESGINVKLFGQNDESVKKSIFSPASDRYTGDLIPPESSAFVSHKNIFNYQAKIIKDLAVKGSCIIVGRCADYILRDMPNVVKVFVWAPMSDCIKNVKVLEPSLSDKEAERKIKKIDAHRSDYYRYYTCREWDSFKKDAVSQEAYEQARTELAMLNADIDIVKSNIALTELRAPFDGVIGLRNVSEGAYASPSVVVAKLTKISPLKIDFFVPERYANQIKPGTRLSFTIEGRQERFEAAVYATESKVDIATRTLAVRAKYPNTRGKLLPGRFATVQIRMHEIPDAIAIPTEALVPEMGVDKVFLYKGGKAHAAEVKTGLRTDSSIQIIDGLNVGDTLITSGTLQLREGLPVKLDTVE